MPRDRAMREPDPTAAAQSRGRSRGAGSSHEQIGVQRGQSRAVDCDFTAGRNSRHQRERASVEGALGPCARRLRRDRCGSSRSPRAGETNSDTRDQKDTQNQEYSDERTSDTAIPLGPVGLFSVGEDIITWRIKSPFPIWLVKPNRRAVMQPYLGRRISPRLHEMFSPRPRHEPLIQA